MDFFKKIINAVSPQLDEEQSNEFQQMAKGFVEDLDGLGRKYMTFSDTEMFKDRWKEQKSISGNSIWNPAYIPASLMVCRHCTPGRRILS